MYNIMKFNFIETKIFHDAQKRLINGVHTVFRWWNGTIICPNWQRSIKLIRPSTQSRPMANALFFKRNYLMFLLLRTLWRACAKREHRIIMMAKHTRHACGNRTTSSSTGIGIEAAALRPTLWLARVFVLGWRTTQQMRAQ